MLAIITCSFPVSNWLETFLSSLPFLPFFLPFFFPSFLPSLLSFFHVQPNFQQTRKMDSGNASSLVSKLLPKWQNEFTLAPHWTVFFFQPLCIFCSFLSLLLSSRGTSKPWICFMHTTCNSILLPGFFFFYDYFPREPNLIYYHYLSPTECKVNENKYLFAMFSRKESLAQSRLYTNIY